MSGGFLLAGTRDGGASSETKRKPSPIYFPSANSSSPIYINVQVNKKRHSAIVDTGSAVTIINQHLLKKINHKGLTLTNKSHQSANSTSIDIIGEIQLEIQIQGHKTTIVADVAKNLVTDLLLGNDWIGRNNVIIDSPQQQILVTDGHCRILATAAFIRPSYRQLPVLLTNEITLPAYSEKCIEITISSDANIITDALFEPNSNLHPKQILLTNALIAIQNNKSQVMIINANDRQRTLSRNTNLGNITIQPEGYSCLILPMTSAKQAYPSSNSKLERSQRNEPRAVCSCEAMPRRRGKVRLSDLACGKSERERHDHPCYVCKESFLTRNDLYRHLREECYPKDMRNQIDKLTEHIEEPDQRQRLQTILWKHGKLFDLRQPSVVDDTVQGAIETGTHPPIHTPPYRVSYKDEQVQRDEIDKLLRQGVIEESTSPWSSPIVLVRKKDGSVRFCVDFRKLNNVTVKDAFPIPRIDDMFDHLSEAQCYTTIDFKSGYFQVALDPKDRSKTAFSTRDQHYQFTVLPQGVTNGPPAFQRIVSGILGPTRWRHSLAYLDDVIIYSQTFNEHLVHLEDILNRLNIANFRLNVEKCHIAVKSINYLGHHIEAGTIRPNSDNIRALWETPRPTTAKEAFRFVKAAEYYRKFIPKFSLIAQPLHSYAPTTTEQRTKKSQSARIELSDEAIHAFEELKRILTHDLILNIPDKQLPFKIQTDASKAGVGAVLMQTYPNGDLPIAYISKKFSSTQMNWPATEQECYAIIYAIEKWHKYLDGRPFVIETDHKPLLPFNMKQQLNSKCERWRLRLQQYQFTIRYIKGKHNTMADYLSRSPVDDAFSDEDDYGPTKSQATQTEERITASLVTSVVTRAKGKQQQQDKRNESPGDFRSCEKQPSERNVVQRSDHSCATQTQLENDHTIDNQIVPFTYEKLKELQHEDEQVKQIMANIEKHDDYFIQDDLLMKKSSPPVPFVPRGRIRADIIKIYHDTPANGAHFGRNKTIEKIQRRYFWPKMIVDIRNHLKTCLPCLQNNHQRQKPPGFLKPIKPPEGIWQLLTMDFHGPITPSTKNGNKYIIALTDALSKFVITKAVRDCTAATAAHFLVDEVILKYGTPKSILTDNGTHFTASMMTELFKRIGVTHLYSTPYHPMTNGQVERYNATMDAKIAALSNDKRTNWDEQLPFVTFNYNTSIHTTTGQIPFEMIYGRAPVLPFDQQRPLVNLIEDPKHVDKLKQYLAELTSIARNNIVRHQHKYKERYDRHRKNPTYNVNDLVLVKVLNRRNKLDARYEGPYRIVQQLGVKTFIVKHVKKPTLVRQVTIDVLTSLCERRTIA